MKERNGFVSNSSSCSFICEICGYDCEYHDGCIDPHDLGLYTCANDHDICAEHVENIKEKVGNGYFLPTEHCPICQEIERKKNERTKWIRE